MRHIKYLRFSCFFLLVLVSGVVKSQYINNFYSNLPSASLSGSRGIQTPDGGILMGGTADNDIFLSKTNGSGDLQWSFRYDINGVNFGESIRSISTITKNSLGINGYLIVGTLFNDFNTNVNSSDAFVMKIDLTGKIIWIHGFSRDGFTCISCGWDDGLSGVELADGSLAISMSVLGDAALVRLNESGDYLNGTAASSSKIVNAGGCCPVAFASGETINDGAISANTGNYFQIGTASNGTLSFNYFYLLNYNLPPSGTAPTILYGKMLGGSVEEKSLRSVDFLPNGDLIACGYTKASPAGSLGDKDGVVMRLDPNGTVVWAKQFGSASPDDFYNVLYDASTANIVVQGVTDQFGGTKEVGIIMDLNGAVSHQSSLNISGIVSDISVMDNNRYLFTGTNANRLQAYISQNTNLSNSICGSTTPTFTVSNFAVSDGNIDPSFNSPFALSDIINNYGNGSGVVITDLANTVTTTENIPNLGVSMVEATEVCAGSGTATFSAFAEGSNLTYQWRENGVNISNSGVYSGVTTNTLSIINPPFALNGKNYDLVVTGACGSITSNAGKLTVFLSPDPSFTRGSISSDQDLCGPRIPAPLTESVPATGGACSKYLYQWEKSEDNGSNWSSVQPTVIASWDFRGNMSNSVVNATTKHPDIGTAVTGLGNGLTSMDFLTDGFTAVDQTATTLAGALAGKDYFSFVVSPIPGKQMNITKIKIRSISQNSNRTFAIFSSVNGFAEPAILGSFTGGRNFGNPLYPFHLAGHSNLAADVEFRIYVYGKTDSYESVGFGNRNSSLSEADFIIEDAANLPGYAPPSISVTTLFRRKAYCNCDSLVSASVKITVNPIPITTAGSNTPVCVGKPLNLTSTAGIGISSYSWTGPNGYTSTAQNPIVTSSGLLNAGTYSVILTQNGCASTSSNVIVNINPAPTTSASSNSPICAGTDLNLTSNAGTGTPTYSWTGPNGFTSTLQNPVIKAANTAKTGTYSVTLTENGCTSAATSTNVTLRPIPTTTAGSNGAVCSGGNINLTSTAGSSTAVYSWTGPNSYTSTLQNPVITAATTAAAGTYSVTLTENGCTSVASPTNVAINAIPAAPSASSNSPVCDGGTLNLTASNGTGVYNWTGPNTYTSTMQNPTLTNITSAFAGAYTVTLTNNGCTSAPSSIDILVNAKPTLSVSTTNPATCGGAGSGTITINAPLGNYDVDLNGDGVYEAAYLNKTPDGAGKIILNNLPNGTVVKDVKVKSISTTCQSVSFAIDTTIAAPGAPNNTTSTTAMCADGLTSRTLVTTTPGGVWKLGPTSTPGVGIVDNINQKFTVGTSSGRATIIYSLGGCDSPIDIEVIAKPTISATSNSPLCAGATLTLNATSGSSSLVYSWTGPNGFTSTLQNPSKTNIGSMDAGAYTVTVNEGACAFAPFAVNVIISTGTTPTAGSNSPICAGNSLNLNASGSIASVYSWSGPNGFSSTEQNPVISNAGAAATGDYSVTVVEKGCISPPSLIKVVVGPPQKINVSTQDPTTCTGTGSATITLSNASGNYDVDLDGDSNYESPYLSSVPNGLTITISNLKNGNIVKNLKVRSTSTGCESEINPINQTITALGSPDNSTDNTPMCGDSKSVRNLITTTPGGTWSLDPNSTSGVGVVDNQAQTFTVGNTPGIAIIVYTYQGCSAQKNINISAPSSTIEASSNSPICDNSSLLLTASGPETASYQWSGPNGFTSSLQNPVIASATPINSGDYSVTMKDNGCGARTLTAAVIINATPVMKAESNSPVCEVGDLELKTTGSGTFSWTGPNSFKSSLQNPKIQGASLASKGKYTVTAVENGCKSIPSFVIVSINSLPEIIVSVLGACGGDGSAKIDVTNHKSGNYDIDLDGDGIFESIHRNQISDTTGKIIISNLASGTPVRNVTILSLSTNCKSSPSPIDTSVSKGGTIRPPVVKDTTVCQGAPPIVLDAGTISGAYLKWYSDSNNALLIPPIHLAAEAKTSNYQVSQILNNCESSKVKITVTVTPFIVDAGMDKFIVPGESVEISASSNGNYKYTWTPSSTLSDATKLKPIASPIENTTYKIFAANKSGCAKSDSMVVYITNDLFIADGFSPNGDKLNDTWEIDGLNSFPNTVVKVYNRWGNLVIQIKNYNKENEWDGNVKGTAMPVGTYYYVLDKGDGSKPILGNITIIR